MLRFFSSLLGQANRKSRLDLHPAVRLRERWCV